MIIVHRIEEGAMYSKGMYITWVILIFLKFCFNTLCLFTMITWKARGSEGKLLDIRDLNEIL